MRMRAADGLGPRPTTILEVIVGATLHGIAVQEGLEGKFLQLALKGTPSLLPAFFVPDEQVRVVTPEGGTLRALAPAVVSRFWAICGASMSGCSAFVDSAT